MLLNDAQSRLIWDKVDDILRFNPSVDTREAPFEIEAPHVVYDISRTSEAASEQMDSLITNAWISCTVPGERIYALDWQHSAFLFDPRDARHLESVYVEDSRCHHGGYRAYFPSYYPDGDYYFFIDEQFRFGYLSHPWRKEVWIFGDRLIDKFENIYQQFHWTVKKGL